MALSLENISEALVSAYPDVTLWTQPEIKFFTQFFSSYTAL